MSYTNVKLNAWIKLRLMEVKENIQKHLRTLSFEEFQCRVYIRYLETVAFDVTSEAEDNLKS